MREVRELLRSLADEGISVFLSSHMLHEVEQTCDRVAVLKEGQIMTRGEVKELLGGQQAVRVRVPSPAAEFNTFTELTDRELEVLRLLAEALSNAEIAERLVISEKTVASVFLPILLYYGQTTSHKKRTCT